MGLQRACAVMCAGTVASQLLSEKACVSSWKSPALYLRGPDLLNCIKLYQKHTHLQPFGSGWIFPSCGASSSKDLLSALPKSS